MRRCYYCGTKKQDDNILCEKYAKELEKRIEKQKKEKENIRKEESLNE